MAEPTPDQVQIAHEVLAGSRQITGTSTVTEPAPPPADLSEQARRDALSAGMAINMHIQDVQATGETAPVNEKEAASAERFVQPHRDKDVSAPGE